MDQLYQEIRYLTKAMTAAKALNQYGKFMRLLKARKYAIMLVLESKGIDVHGGS